MSKFKVSAKSAPVVPPQTREEFVASAAMVQSQTDGRPPKPVRINFDVDPITHKRLQMLALERGVKVAVLVRQLIMHELSK